jgi:hypothetical protein
LALARLGYATAGRRGTSTFPSQHELRTWTRGSKSVITSLSTEALKGRREGTGSSVRILSFLVVALFGTSCVVPPSCIDRAFGASTPNDQHFATLTAYSEPIEEPLEGRYATGIGIWERFERGASITIDARGSMAVSALNMWPERCPRIAREDLAEVSRSWQPVLERMVTPRTDLRAMADPDTGNTDWRPDGPLLSLLFGSASGQSLGLLWDGRSSLPKDLDTAVMGTLEMVCSSSRLAKKYLLRDLPREVASRLECR